MKKIKTITAIISMLALSFAFTLPASAQVEPEDNPKLADSCGLDIAMLLDMTGSIDSGGATDSVKSAAKDFVDAFLPSTPTYIGLVEFSDGTASEIQDLTSDATDLKSDIDALAPSGSTNWQSAFEIGTAMLEGGADRDDAEHADLIVIITDGNPNEPGTNEQALDGAITAANLAKTSSASLPIRIVAIGVGDVNQANLVSVSGPNVNDNPVTKDTDVMTGNFDDLATILGNLAGALCEEPPTDCQQCDRNELNVVWNHNSAFVMNDVEATANTGGNYAGGSYGGSGGAGGDIKNYGGDDVDDSATGSGGAGGNAGTGGTVITGDASSTVVLDNLVNSNLTEIELCPCETNCCSDATGESMSCDLSPFDISLIHNRNEAFVGNRARANALTGANIAEGSYAGEGGQGGDIKNSGEDVASSTTGNGGAGGTGAEGGLVQTGRADSRTSLINTVNVNVTRIFRSIQ